MNESFALRGHMLALARDLRAEASLAMQRADVIGAERARRQYAWRRSMARRIEKRLNGFQCVGQ